MGPIKTERLNGGRLQSIDALRGIAALGVVLYYLIALALFLGMQALTGGINVTHFFVYDVVMHAMLSGLRPGMEFPFQRPLRRIG